MSKHITPELKRAIQERYDGTTEVIDQLVKEFKVPRYTVTSHAKHLGLAKKGNKVWSKEEVEFLIDNYSRGLKYCANKLNRTPKGIELKAKRLKLGGIIKGSHYLTAQNIANIMGIDIHVILNWLNRGLLKYKSAPANRKVYLVKLNDLEAFLKANQKLWDSRKIKDSLWLTDPDWFKEKKTLDNKRPSKEGKKWTRVEDGKAIAMFKTGDYTYKQIGEALNRSSDSVERRLSRLDVWGNGEYVGEKGGRNNGSKI